MGGLTLDGNFIFGAIVIIVNVKVLISSFLFTFWSVMLVVLSIVSFFSFFFTFSQIQVMSTYGEFEHTYSRIQVYLTLLFFTCSFILIDNGM
jgi:amino acid permease